LELDVSALTGAQQSQLAGLLAQLTGASKPAQKAKKQARRWREQAFNDEELAAFFEAVRKGANARDLAIFEIAYHRGLRASEVGGLEFRHLKLPARGLARLYVPRLKNGNGGEYLLTERETKAVRAYLRVRGHAPGPLFPSRKRGAISRKRLDAMMKHYGALASIPEEKRHFHCMRHSCGTSLSNLDIPVQHIQDHLGHRDVRSTMIYVAVSEKKRRELGEKLHGAW
jgi:type 1 fimbriae regulatory protein FimB